MVRIIGSLTNKGLTNFTQEVNWGRSWRPSMHPAAQDSGHWWDSQEKKFGGCEQPSSLSSTMQSKAPKLSLKAPVSFQWRECKLVNTQGSDDCKCRLKQVQESWFIQAKPPSPPRIMTLRSPQEKYISVCFTLQLTVQWHLWHSCDFCFSNKFKFTILETLSRWRKSVPYWTTSPV